jgi:hypothetical protein
LQKGIEAIPWSNLEHACGPAEEVPDLLMSLVSTDEDQRREALYRLMETLWHQGTIYQASSYVVPFLVKMLQSANTPDRAIVAFILAAIADGGSDLDVHAPSGSSMEETWRIKIGTSRLNYDANWGGWKMCGQRLAHIFRCCMNLWAMRRLKFALSLPRHWAAMLSTPQTVLNSYELPCAQNPTNKSANR